jgi:amino acid transporter
VNVQLIARIITMTMFGAICFVLLVPLAVQRHQLPFAVVVVALFVVYVVINAIAWRRNFRR